MLTSPVIMEIPIEAIKLGEQVFEEGMDEDALLESIKRVGILEEPLVEKDKDGSYILRAGFHRLNAAKKLGWSTIRCKVFDYNPIQSVTLQYDTDLCRRHLSPEKIAFYRSIKNRKINALMEKFRTENPEFIEFTEEEFEIIGKLTEKEKEKLFMAIENIFEKKYADKMAELAVQITKKDDEIEKIRQQQVDIEKLQKLVSEKLAEKEKELEWKVQEKYATQSEQDLLKKEKQIEALKEEIDSLREEFDETVTRLRETSKKLDSIKREKDLFEEEKKKILEQKKMAEDLAVKFKNEAEFYKKNTEVETKKLEIKVKQQQQYLEQIVNPENIMSFLTAAKGSIKTAGEIMIKAYGLLSPQQKKKIMALKDEISDLLQVFVAFEKESTSNEEVETVEVPVEN